MNASLVFTITGTSPSTNTTAPIGSAIDFGALPADATQPGLELVDDLDVIASLQGATGDTLDLYLQTSTDKTTWTDYAHFAQLASAAAALVVRFGVSRFAQQTTIATVGQGTSPAATGVVGGPVARYMRLIGKAGASTSLGATQTITLRASGVRKASMP